MKKALPLLAFVAFLPACAPAPKTATPPVPDAAMSARSKVKLQTLQRGHAVYLANCGRCHEYILPKDVSREDWHVVVPGMAWNASISPKDEKAVTAYVMAAKK
jgi:cytochrome c5